MNPPSGRLLLVPNGLDLGTDCEVDLREVVPDRVLSRAAGIEHWVVENAKSARAFLKRVGQLVPLCVPLQGMKIFELPRPQKGSGSEAKSLDHLLAPALAGHDVGLLSEAGLPAVADPGAGLVEAAHRLGLSVLPLSGPSSLMLALAASGLNGQSFAFVGYLPVDNAGRSGRIRELDLASRRHAQTQIAIETPYRNLALFHALLEHLQPTTRLCVASGLTLPSGWCRTLDAQAWRQVPAALGNTTPAVFLWLAR